MPTGAHLDPVAILQSVVAFAAIPEDELRTVAVKLELRSLAAGTTIVREGEPADSCFLIADGELGVITKDLIGGRVVLATLGPGELFGEIALVRHGPRTATVEATRDATVYALRRADFAALQATCPAFAAEMRQRVDRLLLDTCLRTASPFARLDGGVIARLEAAFVPLTADAGATIIREGDVGDRFYLLRSGRVAVWQGRQRLREMQAGDYFGEVALLTGDRRSATVEALERTELLALDKADFDALVRHEARVGQHVAETARIRSGRRSPVLQADHIPLPQPSARPRRVLTGQPPAWLVLAGGIILFSTCTLVAAASQLDAAKVLTVLVGAAVGPLSFVAYLAETNVLAHRPRTLLITFALGGVVSFPLAFAIERMVAPYVPGLSAAGSTALIEEALKLVAVGWLVRRSARFTIDGVIFGAAAGMGFATCETMLYGLNRVGALDHLLGTLWLRTLLAPFGHGTWTAIICAALWSQKGSGGLRLNRWVALAFGLSVALHTLWDVPTRGLPSDVVLFWLVGVGLVGIAVLRGILRRATHEEAAAVLALNPELGEVPPTMARADQRVTCRACGQEAPLGAHYCARCGAALRLSPS